MKKDFFACPKAMEKERFGFSWMEYVTAIPSPLVAVSSYKSNGKSNVAMQSWLTFTNDREEFFVLFGSVNKHQHMYASVRETGCLVVNFPSREIFPACMSSIQNNGEDIDEIAASGLTSEPAVKVAAPRIKECFLNLECELAWEKELAPGSDIVVMCARVVGFSMEEGRCHAEAPGRYGETGYLYNIHSPTDPESGAKSGSALGVIRPLPPYDFS